MAVDSVLSEKLRIVWPYLNERQRRVLLGAEAKVRGRGGISQVAEAAGMSWPTVPTRTPRTIRNAAPSWPPAYEPANWPPGGRPWE